MKDYKRLTDKDTDGMYGKFDINCPDYTDEEKKKHLTVVLCGMKKRCYQPSSNCYKNYGGRGIKVCDEWLGKDGQTRFREWALANGYRKGLTIDRIDNDGDYSPKNCRWATIQTQAYNRSTNSRITIKGKTQTVTEWAKEIGISIGAMQQRLRSGWSEERLLEPAYKPLKRTKAEMSKEIRRLRKFEEEIKQKIEQGLLVVLPVKIGETVYKIDSDIDYEWGKDSHRCTIKYYPRAVKIKNNADLFYFMYMREIDEMFETEEQAFEKLKKEKTMLEERYADNEFIDEVFVELRGGK